MECACQACTSPSEGSDDRMRVIRELLDTVQSVGFNDVDLALELCEQLLGVMRLEGLDSPLDTHSIHYMAYELAKSIVDPKYARCSLEHMDAAVDAARII